MNRNLRSIKKHVNFLSASLAFSSLMDERSWHLTLTKVSSISESATEIGTLSIQTLLAGFSSPVSSLRMNGLVHDGCTRVFFSTRVFLSKRVFLSLIPLTRSWVLASIVAG